MAVKKPKLAPRLHCPVEATLEVIGAKWKAVILFWLRDQTCRFGELRRKIPGISERMLAQQLRDRGEKGSVEMKRQQLLPFGEFEIVRKRCSGEARRLLAPEFHAKKAVWIRRDLSL